MDCSTKYSPVLHYLLEFAQIHVHWVGDSNPLVLCCPLLLLSSIFPSIRIFSNELALPIRWSNYWSFSTLRYPHSFLLDHSCLTTFNLPWLMDLTFQAVGVVWSLLYNVWASAWKIQMEWGNLDSWVLRASRECSEKAMAPHSSTLAWKIPRTEEPGRLQSMGLLRVRDNWATSL